MAAEGSGESNSNKERKKYFDALQDADDEKLYEKLQNNDIEYFKHVPLSSNVIEYVLAFGNKESISKVENVLQEFLGKMEIPLKTYQLALNMGRVDFVIQLLKKQDLTNDTISGLYKLALDENNTQIIDILKKEYDPKKSVKKKKSKSVESSDSPNTLNSKRKSDEVDAGTNTTDDPLQQMKAELNKLHIHSDPRYLFSNEKDPVKATINISKKLVKYKKEFPQNKDEIESLIKRCKNFMLTVVGLCETNAEVGCLLNKNSKQKKIVKHGRLWKALDGELVECIAHPNTQSWLYGKWLGNLSHKWEKKSWKSRIIYVLPRFLFFPIMSLYYSVAPDKKISPMNCFIHSVASYYFFLISLLVTIFGDKVIPASQSNNADQYTTIAQYIVIVWLVSYFFLTIVDFTFITYPSHRHAWWTIYQFVMLCMFWSFGTCHLVMRGDIAQSSIKYLSIIKDGCFAIAVTMAFMKILHWFHLSATLGPVIISFSKMTTVICKMLIIFAVVLFSFSFGMHSLYRNAQFPDKDEEDDLDDDKTFFNNYVNTLKMLFWVIFGYGRANAAGIPNHIDEVNNTNTSDYNDTDHGNNPNHPEDDQLRIIAQIGYYMWAIFHVTFVVVLLNMLIAIMTTTYETIQEKSDVTWKRARTKIWLYYMGKHNAVPPPFNIIKYIRNVVVWAYNKFSEKNKNSGNSGNAETGQSTKKNGDENYEALIRRLASRYRTKYWIENPKILKTIKKMNTDEFSVTL